MINESDMTGILLGLHFGLPVHHIDGKPYLVVRAVAGESAGQVLAIGPDKRLGTFYAVEWKTERLAEITVDTPLLEASQQLGLSYPTLNLAPSHFGMRGFWQHCQAEFNARQVRDIDTAYEIAEHFYHLCLAAEVFDVAYLTGALRQLSSEYFLEITYSDSFEGLRAATSMLGVFLAFNDERKLDLAAKAEDALQLQVAP